MELDVTGCDHANELGLELAVFCAMSLLVCGLNL